MSGPRRIAHVDLERFFKEALMAVGVPEHVAAVEAEIGAEVDLCGVHTHGARLLPTMVEHIKEGRTNGAPELEAVVEYPASALYATDRGLGRYVSAVCMDRAVAMAREYGIGAVAVRGVAHWGRAHSYALRAAKDGMVGLCFTNAIVNFAAWGTSTPTLGNNPFAIGVPGAPPAVLDLAMSQSSVSRVRMAAQVGERVPLGWGLDAEGRPTDDPQAIIDSGRFLPMGGHKGSGLAFMVELLTAGLANGLLCFEQGTLRNPTDTAGGSAKLFIAIRPYGDWLPERLAELVAHLKDAPPAPEQGEAQWPGEGSFRRRQDYERTGIELPGPLVAELDALAEDLGLGLQWA